MDLIVKMLTNEITPEEKLELDAWLSKNRKNEKLLEEYQAIWDSSENYTSTQNSAYQPDVNAGYARLKQKINLAKSEQKEINQKSVIRKLIFYGAAASLFLVTVGIVLMMFNSRDNFKAVEVATLDGETKTVELVDGSTIVLNQGSKLYYGDKFNKSNRIVTLEGEAFFDIKKDIDNPFIVKGANTEVKVLGTSFNYRTYKDEKHSSVAVTSGKVQFSGKGGEEDEYKYIVLEKNESGKYNKEQKNLSKYNNLSENEYAWKSGKLVFKETPIDIVFRDIENFYRINIDYSKSNVKKCKFNSIFDSSPLNDVLESLRHSLEVSITNTPKGDYLVSEGRKCK